MNNDPELKAMGDTLEALNSLPDNAARERVLKWVMGKFELAAQTFTVAPKILAGGSFVNSTQVSQGTDFSAFQTVDEIFSAANPTKDYEKALVIAAYIQETEGKRDLTGMEISSALKHLGHGVSNITSTLSSLMDKKPQLMCQTRKEGKSIQAKKKYRVTGEGLKVVRAMLANTQSLES